MSIDEMIRVLEGDEEYLQSWHKEAVVEALKAGQAMRNNLFDITKEWKLDEALKAWDAATK